MPDPPEGPPNPFFDSSLELVGLGHDGSVYGISSRIVVKVARTHDLVGLSAAEQQRLSDDHTRSVSMLAKERHFFEKLDPHPSIVSAVSLDYPEGMYLTRYTTDIDLFLETNGRPSLSIRMGWYTAILSALSHMHEQSLVHSDVHEANMLCDENGLNVALCDFLTSAIWGETVSQRERAEADGRVTVPFDKFDDRLDRWQAAKFLLRRECGADAEDWLTHTEDDEIGLTQPVRTGNAELDVVITNGLLSKYTRTRTMLEALVPIAAHAGVPLIHDTEFLPRRVAEQTRLKEWIRTWRAERIRTLGYVIKEAP